MPDRTNLIYEYDGSFDGLLCCVFESYTRREHPMDIRPEGQGEATLFPIRQICSDAAHAQRVWRSVERLGKEMAYLVSRAFLYGLEGKELAIWRLIAMGYKYGGEVVHMLGEEAVSQVRHMVRAVGNEAHLQLEFLRFSQYEGGLASVIGPKHYILPLMSEHFCRRYSEERFLIHDRTHGLALVYQPYQAALIQAEEIALPGAQEDERFYRRLWKGYYDAIGIEARENPVCRRTHMPMRFWPYMTEFQPEEGSAAWPAFPSAPPQPLLREWDG